MKKKKIDRRIARTKEAIKAAFLALLDEKEIAKITVRELCEKANINRSSFYDHYVDYPEFLNSMESELANELFAQFDELFIRDDYPEVTMKKLLHFLRHNQNAKILFSNFGDKAAARIMEEQLRIVTFQDWLQYEEITEAQAEYLYRFIMSGGSAVIQQWHNNGYREDEDEIQALLVGVITNGLYSFLPSKRKPHTITA